MDSYYNYVGKNQPIQPPYSNNVSNPQPSQNVIPRHVPLVSYAYGANNVQLTPQKKNFKGFAVNQVPFLFLQDHRRDYKSAVDDALKGRHDPTPLNELYFSEENIIRVQKAITNEVKRRTGNKVIVDDQNKQDVLLLMENSYYEYGRFLPFNIEKQVNELNAITVREAVPEIITQIKQHLSYIRDIERPRDVLPLPMNVNSAGRKSIKSLSNLFEF